MTAPRTYPPIDEALIAKIMADPEARWIPIEEATAKARSRQKSIEVDRYNVDLAYRIFTYGIGLVGIVLIVFAVVVR